jgi:hypothetical protein
LAPSLTAIQTLQQQAEHLNLSIIVGRHGSSPNGKPYIASLLIHPHLPVLAYSKMYLYAGAEKYVSPGHSYIDFEQLGLHIGMAVVLIRATTAIHATMPIYRPMRMWHRCWLPSKAMQKTALYYSNTQKSPN